MIGKFLNQYNVKSLNKTRLKLEKLFMTDDFDKISLYLYKNKMEKLDKNMVKTKYVNRFILSIMVLCLYQCLHILKYKEPNKNIKNFLKYIPLVKFSDKVYENYVSKYFVYSYKDNCYSYLDDYSELFNSHILNLEFKFDNLGKLNNSECTDWYVDVSKCLNMNKPININKCVDMNGYVSMKYLNKNNISGDYVEPKKIVENYIYDVPRSIKNNNVHQVQRSIKNNNIYQVPKSVRNSDYQNIECLADKMLKFNISFEDLLKESDYDEIPFTSQNFKQQLSNLNRSINNLLIK